MFHAAESAFGGNVRDWFEVDSDGAAPRVDAWPGAKGSKQRFGGLLVDHGLGEAARMASAQRPIRRGLMIEDRSTGSADSSAGQGRIVSQQQISRCVVGQGRCW